jgi:hypothetical protein
MKILEGCEIEECSITLSQTNDCCDSGTLGQLLFVKSQDSGAGKFLTLQTERWAIDDIDGFCEMLKSILETVEGKQNEKGSST